MRIAARPSTLAMTTVPASSACGAATLANAAGYFELARRTRQLAVDQGRGASIVLLGSMYGQVASYPDAYAGICNASPVAYHALKGGIIHMTRHLAVYWAADKVRVNCLSPGPFPIPNGIPAEMERRLSTKVPQGRMGRVRPFFANPGFRATLFVP